MWFRLPAITKTRSKFPVIYQDWRPRFGLFWTIYRNWTFGVCLVNFYYLFKSLSGLNCHDFFDTNLKKFELFQVSYADIPTKKHRPEGDTAFNLYSRLGLAYLPNKSSSIWMDFCHIMVFQAHFADGRRHFIGRGNDRIHQSIFVVHPI